MTSPALPRRGFKPTGEPYPNPMLDGALLANQEDEDADRRDVALALLRRLRTEQAAREGPTTGGG